MIRERPRSKVCIDIFCVLAAWAIVSRHGWNIVPLKRDPYRHVKGHTWDSSLTSAEAMTRTERFFWCWSNIDHNIHFSHLCFLTGRKPPRYTRLKLSLTQDMTDRLQYPNIGALCETPFWPHQDFVVFLFPDTFLDTNVHLNLENSSLKSAQNHPGKSLESKWLTSFVWEKTTTFLMWPWPVRMVNILRHTGWSWQHPVPSSKTFSEEANKPIRSSIWKG